MKQILNHEESSAFLDYLCGLHREHGGGTELRVIRQPHPKDAARIKELRDKIKEEPAGAFDEKRQLLELMPKPTIGLFSDHETLLASLQSGIASGPDFYERSNTYVTLNPVGETGGRSAGAGSITNYLWLPIDLDPIRYELDKFGVEQFLADKNLSTSDRELQNASNASEVIRSIIETITGTKPTIVGLSGNGRHLLYRIEAYGKESVSELSQTVKEILSLLSTIFTKTPLSKNLVSVDTKVYDPSRIWKLYGVLSQKGEDTADRPHRMSAVLEMRPTAKPLTREQLGEIISYLKKFLAGHGIKDVAAKEKSEPTGDAPSCEKVGKDGDWVDKFKGFDLLSLDVIPALRDAGIVATGRGEVDGENGEKKEVIFVDCPNKEQHSTADGDRDAVVYLPKVRESGPHAGKRIFASFDCFHDHCAHMRGAEYFHTQLVKPDVIKRHCEEDDMGGDAPPLPECTGEGLDLGKTEFKAPEPIKIKRDLIRNMDWMLDETTTEAREVLVPGLLYRGEVMTLSAPTKVGKTFQLMHAAVAWANGAEFLGLAATKRLNVLYIDPELFEDQAKNRLKVVALNTVKGKPANVNYINLRYHKLMATPDPWGVLMDNLEGLLDEGESWDLIIVDSMYKFQGDTNLNDSAAVNRMLLKLKVVTGAGCQPAIIYVHHYAKGDPGLKKSTDRSAGSFAFSADADTIVTLTPHPLTQETGVPHYNVEFTLRHWAPKDPVVVKRCAELPMLMPVDGAKPQVDSAYLKRRGVAAQLCLIIDRMIKPHVSQAKPYSSIFIKTKDIKDAAVAELNITHDEATKLIKMGCDEEWVYGDGHGPGRCYCLSEAGQHIIKELSKPDEPEGSDEPPTEPEGESKFAAARGLV